MKTLLLISHSSNMTGGSEDEFQKLLIYLSGKYKIYTIFPKGYRSEIFKKYSDKFLEIDLRLFPFTKFRFKEYLGYFRRNFKKIIAIYKFIKNNNDINLCFVNSSVCLIEIIAIVLSRKPYLLSVKEKINPFLPRKIIYYFYGQTALKILTISKFLQNEIEIHTKRKDIEIIYSTIDENSFEQMTKQFVSK
ncbi:MAG: hypothetical protein NTU73_05820, partial [Ignavibacteriae bacterium]|nr:hypothetical protein [Ignavibacteriota bacterium]